MQAEALDAAEAAERAKVGTLNMYQLECVRGGAAFVRGDDGHGATAQGAGRAAGAQLLVVVPTDVRSALAVELVPAGQRRKRSGATYM